METNETKREDGFYWVKWKNSPDAWRVVEYYDEFWLIPGDGDDWLESDFFEIGPRIFPPA